MRAVGWIGFVGLGVAMAACGSEAEPPDDASTTSSSSSTGGMGGAGGMTARVCDSAAGEVDPGWETIAYHLGPAMRTYRELDFTNTQLQFNFSTQDVHEAVRFELPHPARVHGFRVMWANLPDGQPPDAGLEAGLYGDFGYNGFDFWAADPLAVASRCADEIDGTGDEGAGWTTYVLPEPVTVEHPGLVYVAHRTTPTGASWWFDTEVENPMAANPCENFDDCQSAFNLPETKSFAGTPYYPGLSISLQYHFKVELLVEYTETLADADRVFQPVANAPSGRHVSWADFDADGYDDLLLGRNLWRNQGDGTFTDVTTAMGLDAAPHATGGVWGDYDNDGCVDVFLFSESLDHPDTLMHATCANGVTSGFTPEPSVVDVQNDNECGDPSHTTSPSAAAAWADFDADGYLDLYVANFNCWDDYSYYTDTVFMNDGDGTFTEVTASNGFMSDRTPSRGVSPVDADRDGDIDVFVNNYVLVRNLYFENQGDGTMVEKAEANGTAGVFSPPQYYGHTIGAAWGDVDGDGDFDLISANLAHPRFFDFSHKSQVLLNDGSGAFTDLAGDWSTPFGSPSGLRYQETHSVPLLGDVDQDGHLDLAITAVYDGRPTDFYWGVGDGSFRLDAYHAGITTENGWGIGAADFDHDGDLDVFADRLFENTIPNAGHFLQLRVVGTTANRSGIGATVAVTAGGKTQIRHVQGGTGKGGQDSLYLHYGLGMATTVDTIVVTFPGGASVTYAGPFDADQRLWLFQDQTTPVASWGRPN